MELIDLVNSDIVFLSQATLLRRLTFLLTSQAVTLGLFLFSDVSICSKMDFPSLANSDHVVVSVSIDVPLNLQRNALFRRITYEYYRANWDLLCDHLRSQRSLWSLNLLLLLMLVSEFCECVQVGNDVYIPHCKCQLKPVSLIMGFSYLCYSS